MDFRCPTCSARLRTPFRCSGRSLRCPRCHQTLAVPASEPTSPPPTRRRRRWPLWCGAGLLGVTLLAGGFALRHPFGHQQQPPASTAHPLLASKPALRHRAEQEPPNKPDIESVALAQFLAFPQGYQGKTLEIEDWATFRPRQGQFPASICFLYLKERAVYVTLEKTPDDDGCVKVLSNGISKGATERRFKVRVRARYLGQGGGITHRFADGELRAAAD